MGVSIKANLEMKGLKDLKKRLKKLDRKEIEWGFLGGEHSTANMSYAELAEILEYGTRSNDNGYEIPPRPAFTTLVSNLETSHRQYEVMLTEHYRDFVLGITKNPDNILQESGEHVTERHKEMMYSWVEDGTVNQHNAGITIKLKDFDRPFVESGELIDNVTYNITN